ncbi:MAG TPA: rhodanese-like domain-containing protein [Dehalococcoidales bacterium]|nr:rhodanese-like domain-containing protein [Dehalococcoidales bacterium]
MTAKQLCILAVLVSLTAALVLLGACSNKVEPGIPGQVIEDVSLEEAFTLMEDNRGRHDFIIIDLRSADEYASGHIEEAINLDYSSPDFARELDELDRNNVYLLCSQKDDVSGRVLDMMVGLGFAEVYNMVGGMERWERIRLPQVK